MQVYSAMASASRGAEAPRAAAPADGRSLLLTENATVIGRTPSLLAGLTQDEREHVLQCGQRRVFYRGRTVFSQGTRHDGIYLIETGRIRVFYTAPSQREITLAYWLPGNFVGGPEVFGEGMHQWSGMASANSSVVHLRGKELRKLALEVPNLAIGLIEGLAFKGKCYSGLAQMLGTRSITERLAHLLLHLVDLYGMKVEDGMLIGAAFTHADLAHMVGATRQWVTISLKRLEERNVLISRKSQIIIRRRETLDAMRGQGDAGE
jgi:CRP-like cAMP-binding protein